MGLNTQVHKAIYIRHPKEVKTREIESAVVIVSGLGKRKRKRKVLVNECKGSI